jgi:hypothetical protein
MSIEHYLINPDHAWAIIGIFVVLIVIIALLSTCIGMLNGDIGAMRHELDIAEGDRIKALEARDHAREGIAKLQAELVFARVEIDRLKQSSITIDSIEPNKL